MSKTLSTTSDQLDKDTFLKLQKSPIFFVEWMWGLVPQQFKPGYDILAESTPLSEWRSDWFLPFVKGTNITWQQLVVLKAVENAMNGKAKRRLSISSGHGIGKSTVMAWMLLWFLFCFKDSQIPCTAPTSDQMFDVLWKEVARWHSKMPEKCKKMYDISNNYVRIVQRPETWFARAKTARKEAPEALAGIHGDYVMMLVDEASAVPDQIFVVAEGALTNENILLVLISNPTRLEGYFYDSHHNDSGNWQTFRFNSLDSPIVDNSYVDRMKEKHGEDSDEFRVRVMGEFPREDRMDDKGWSRLVFDDELNSALQFIDEEAYIGTRMMGLDVARGGGCKNVWVLRTENFAKVIAKSEISDIMDVASQTILLAKEYRVNAMNVFVDDTGIGGGVVDRLHQLKFYCNGVQGAGRPDDMDMFVNKRAENFWGLKEWIRLGGKLNKYDDWKEALSLKYKAAQRGKIIMMSKVEMAKNGIPSPDTLDALAMTFSKPPFSELENERAEKEDKDSFDKWDLI